MKNEVTKTGLRIGIADDHMLVRKALERTLTSYGHQVCVSAQDGEDLICQLESGIEADVCLIDINMPGMNGFDTAAELKKRWSQVRVLALTGFDDEMMVIRMIAAGAQGYLVKSCAEDQLDKAISVVAEYGVFFNELMSNRLYQAVQRRELKLANITELEMSVLRYCCSDLSYDGIAKRLHTTRRSVESARDRLFDKFGVRSRVSLALLAVRHGYVTLEAIGMMSVER